MELNLMQNLDTRLFLQIFLTLVLIAVLIIASRIGSRKSALTEYTANEIKIVDYFSDRNLPNDFLNEAMANLHNVAKHKAMNDLLISDTVRYRTYSFTEPSEELIKFLLGKNDDFVAENLPSHVRLSTIKETISYLNNHLALSEGRLIPMHFSVSSAGDRVYRIEIISDMKDFLYLRDFLDATT